MATANFVIQSGTIRRTTTEDHIKWCVKSLLSMQRGELSASPEIGADLMPLMFRRDNDELREEVLSRVRKALSDWEPRIEVEDTAIQPDDAEPSLLSIKIKYRIKETRRSEVVKVLL